MSEMASHEWSSLADALHLYGIDTLSAVDVDSLQPSLVPSCPRPAPFKPLSAYALFFREVHLHVRREHPSASFGEISRHVALLWQQLDEHSKRDLKERANATRNELLGELARQKARLLSQPFPSSSSNGL